MQNEFFRQPPWYEGKNKHRLGLRPVELDDLWCPDQALHRNKLEQLKNRYNTAVATLPGYEDCRWSLPGLSNIETAYPDWIANLGSCVAEDLCVLDTLDHNRLIAGCLAAPSYWSLQEKMGQPLDVVHTPVEGMNEKIGARIEGFFTRLPAGRPFRRENWFVHSEAIYYRESAHLRSRLGGNPETWFFRSERQTLLRLDERFVLFVIGIVFAPVVELGRHPEAVSSLKSALAAMDEDEITHFGGLAKFKKIAEYVRAL